MGTKCGACDGEIFDLLFMECTTNNCHKVFHVKCLGKSVESFEALTEESKLQWICPECTRMIPKQDNTNTPIRGGTIMDKTFTPTNFVSTERGSRGKILISKVNTRRGAGASTAADYMEVKENSPSPESESIAVVLSAIQQELHTIRIQNESILPLKQEVERLSKVVENMSEAIVDLKRIILEKNNHILSLEERTLHRSEHNISSKSYSSVTAKRTAPQQSVTRPSDPSGTQRLSAGAQQRSLDERQTALPPSSPQSKRDSASAPARNMSSDGARKLAIVSTLESGEITTPANRNTENEWKVVQSRKKKELFTEVMKGGNNKDVPLKGIERKKHLHIWRLRKNTCEKDILDHVAGVCGSQNEIKVEKLKTKTERDYASFIVGVPESMYDKICQPEVWPVNVEFSEWIWFRKRYPIPTSDSEKAN
ncbi:hypothetical protein JYU34_012842 [Plutella xylostella]|uniref:PHD-type domain-containing protein n=1 Tax=Plutella xylostella TaxID=51655 RepID=A0ABQ7QCK2_PLUXY|nr:hypothetical protein JYU34_012842 [Plutella xylostella]